MFRLFSKKNSSLMGEIEFFLCTYKMENFLNFILKFKRLKGYLENSIKQMKLDVIERSVADIGGRLFHNSIPFVCTCSRISKVELTKISKCNPFIVQKSI